MTCRMLGRVFPRERAARHHVIAHRLHVAGPDPLVAAQRRHLPRRRREFFDEDRIVAVVAVHRHRRREADGGDAGHAGEVVDNPDARKLQHGSVFLISASGT